MLKSIKIALKIIISKFLKKFFPSKLPPILIASMGRSGSTVLHDSICEAYSRSRFPFLPYKLGMKIIRDQAWDLKTNTFISGWVYKTHGLADELPIKNNLKVIFIFGSASDAALSVLACHEKYGQAWINRHFEHLRANGTFDDLDSKDVLRFEEQIDGWVEKNGTERLIIHYESLWENEKNISKFIGLPIKLPKRKEREGAGKASKNTRILFDQTYSTLNKKIESLPKFQIRN